MTTLAIETSTNKGSIAVGDENHLIREFSFEGGKEKRHSFLLFSVLEKLEVSDLEIDRIVVGLGPGSFSGIRVALAAAQAIALVKKVPIHGICSAFSVAQQKKEVTRLGVFADARRGEFYGTIFQGGKLQKESHILTAEELDREIGRVTLAVSAEALPGIAGRAWPRAKDFLLILPESSDWVKGALEPIYLRTFEPKQ